MTRQPQTAIRGVLSVGVVNLLARFLAYGKHLVIAALIGLSVQLDTFYMALSVLSLVIFAFGDIFDSLGIPRLVETLREEGDEPFKELAGEIMVFACLLSLLLCGFLFLIAPWTTWIAPGFTPEEREFVLDNLRYLAPLALIYLPYHAVGSFLRAKRRFQLFYVGELIVAFSSLCIVLLWHQARFIIPLSFSVGYLVAFAYIVAIGSGEFRWHVRLPGEKIRGIVRMLFRLFPIYLMNYLFLLVDRAFASFLPTGGVSALSYALLIVLIPASILMIENVFITPLSESTEKAEMFRSILEGIIIISIPIAVFSTAYAERIVGLAFERGVFTAGSTKLTGEALACFSISIPVLFMGPICTRFFQIQERMGVVTKVVFFSVLVNAGLNLLFLKMGMGIQGVALASSLAWYCAFAGYMLALRRLGYQILDQGVARVFCISLAISVIALGCTALLPFHSRSAVGLLFKGGIFLVASAAMFSVSKNEKIRYWKETVLAEILRRER